jgi:hypothetical protein
LSIGFLTVVRQVEHGYVGGYLIVNPLARPIEFHCTLPVKPNRAQEILYGRTLEPYLLGEQIAATLIGKSSSAPLLVCTDEPHVLVAQTLVQVPVALVVRCDSDGAAAEPPELLAAHHHAANGTVRAGTTTGGAGHSSVNDVVEWPARVSTGERAGAGRIVTGPSLCNGLRWSRYELLFTGLSTAAQQEVERRLNELSPDFDLCEPLDRIREAVAEAQRATAA